VISVRTVMILPNRATRTLGLENLDASVASAISVHSGFAVDFVFSVAL